MSRERWIVASAMLLAVGTRTTPAAAQACCAGGALVNPARLALHEDYAVGLQTRVRQDLGSFDPDGRYHSSANEQDFEQDLAAAFASVPEPASFAWVLATGGICLAARRRRASV